MARLQPDEDIDKFRGTFKTEVEDEYTKHFPPAMIYLKDYPVPVTGGRSSGSGGSSGASHLSGVKREAVLLPKFSGKEPACFLEYPIWETNWEKLVTVYPEEVRVTVLFDHLDATAKVRLVGLENDYKESMKKLKSYFGNNLKVVQCALSEIASVKAIKGPFDYNGLVYYSRVVEQNYKQLLPIGEEKELSNTTVTNEITLRLPAAIQSEYYTHYMKLSVEDMKNPLPQLIAWMEEQRKRWEYQETAKAGSAGGRSILAHYGTVREEGRGKNGGSSGFSGECFKCEKKGHMQADCRGEKVNKIEGKPKHKVTWCAFHVDPPLKHHTVSCTKPRKMSFEERLPLLKTNKDFEICCGDHAKSKCTSNRVCGGEKQKSGCGTNHNLHELFCQHSKITACPVPRIIYPDDSAPSTEVTMATRSSRNIVLMIMKVQGINKQDECWAIWDSCSTGRFVRDAYARQCRFKSRKELLTVITLEGKEKTYLSTVYTCYFHDLDGVRYTFEAHGLDTVTGTMGKLDMSVIKALFPGLTQKEIFNMQ